MKAKREKRKMAVLLPIALSQSLVVNNNGAKTTPARLSKLRGGRENVSPLSRKV